MSEKDLDDDYRTAKETRDDELERIRHEERESAAYLEELNAPAE